MHDMFLINIDGDDLNSLTTYLYNKTLAKTKLKYQTTF